MNPHRRRGRGADHSTGIPGRAPRRSFAGRRPCDTRAVTDRAALCLELATTWHRDIPLAAAMQIRVDSYDGRTLTVRAPLPPNRNLHGTAFAGSLYSACVLTGWGATWLALREHGLEGMIVVAESSIEYRKAVGGDLVCHCTPDAAVLHAGLDKLRESGRARFELACSIESNGQRAVRFTGEYVVNSKHA
jgi:thioesterase domain-containing protein